MYIDDEESDCSSERDIDGCPWIEIGTEPPNKGKRHKAI
jgi:hypothetical protein